MNTKSRIKSTLCLLLLCCCTLCGQNYSKFKIDGLTSKNYVQTPEMTAIRQVSMSSVNHSTGAVDIRIPLLDIECGELKLPIYLSYNSTGIKVNEPCGWVGQNWTLHAEPMLTRTPRGHIDGNGKCSFDFYKDKTNYYWTRIYLDNNLTSAADNMPDEYNFSLLTGGGMFMYCQTQDGQDRYVCLPYDDMVISYAGHFVVVDSQGTIYRYNGGVDKSITPNMYETSWHASSVLSANGIDSIAFRYENVKRVNIKRHEDHITVVDNYKPTTLMGYRGGWSKYELIDENALEINPDAEELLCMPVVYKTFDNFTKSYQVDANHELVDDGRTVNKIEYYPNFSYEYQHLSQISYCGNQVAFLADGNGNLADIIQTNSNGQQISHYRLGYELHRDRYYLTEVKELSATDETISVYHLNYQNVEKVTRPGGRAYDFWGYNNSDYLYDDVSLVPPMKLYIGKYKPMGDYVEAVEDSLEIGGDPSRLLKKVRHADEAYMQCGMLSSIEHPTGARETFVWEANRAKIEDRINMDNISEFNIKDELIEDSGKYIVGGLRIKEINITEDGQVKLKRIYKYGKDENSAGTTPLRNGINYFMRIQTKIYDNVSLRTNMGNSQSRYRTLSSSPMVPITYYNGASVMYDTVTEYIWSGGNPVSKTVYKYRLPDIAGNEMLTQLDVWDSHIHNYANWFTDCLCSKDVYEKTDGGYLMVSSDAYGYNTHTYPKVNYTIKGREYRNDFHENFSDLDLTLISNLVSREYRDYSVTPKAKLLMSHTHSEKMSNGITVTNTQTCGYDNPSDIRVTSRTLTRGDDSYSLYISYPSTINQGVYLDMVKHNQLDCPVEECLERNGRIVSARLMTYAKQGGCYYPNKVYTYEPGMSGCLRTDFTKFDGDSINSLYVPQLDIAYDKGRVEHLTDRQGISVRYNWDKFLQYPIAETKSGNGLVYERTFTYMPGIGMTSETAPNTNRISYVYDSAGRLSMTKDDSDKTLQKYEYKYVSGSAVKGEMPEASIEPTNISLVYTLNSMPFSMSHTIKAVLIPSTAETTIVWKSSNTNVAKVSAEGTVEVVGNGVCYITATTQNGLSASCKITALGTSKYYNITAK